MKKRYTLTLYIAPPNGTKEHKDSSGNIVKDNSQAGHIFYAISDGGGIPIKRVWVLSGFFYYDGGGTCCCKRTKDEKELSNEGTKLDELDMRVI